MLTSLGTIANSYIIDNDTIVNNNTENGWGVRSDLFPEGQVNTLDCGNFNDGFIANPYDLLSGRVAGLRLSAIDGSPGGDYWFSHHGTLSFATRAPQFFVDDMPVFYSATSLNPYDIEKVSIIDGYSGTLADLNPYGGMAFQLKRGSENFEVNYLGQAAFSYLPKKIDVFSADEFRRLVSERYSDQIGLLEQLGDANTDWQDEIYRQAFSQQHHLSFSGTIANKVPFYASYGRTVQNGIVKTSNWEQNSFLLNVTPRFFDDHLALNFNIRKTVSDRQMVDETIFWYAMRFNPTQPVYNTTGKYGGYYTYENGTGEPASCRNPVSLLHQKNYTSENSYYSIYGKLKYKVHFLPELKLIANYGKSVTDYEKKRQIDGRAAWVYNRRDDISFKRQTNEDKFYSAFFDYTSKGLNSWIFSLKAGYSRVELRKEENSEWNSQIRDITTNRYNAVLSFRGTLGYRDRYFLYASFFNTKTSHFSGYKASIGSENLSLIWNLKKEFFQRSSTTISHLNVFAGVSKTLSYGEGESSNRLYSGVEDLDDVIAVNSGIQAENNQNFDIGVECGIWNNRLKWRFLYYDKKVNELIYYLEQRLIGNQINTVKANLGGLKSRGIDILLDADLVKKNNLTWSISGNFSYNNEVYNSDYDLIDRLNIKRSIVSADDKPFYSYYTRPQVYSSDGKPIEGVYETSEGNTEYEVGEQLMPKFILGLLSKLEYKKWSLDFSGKLHVGNHNYNEIEADAYYNGLYYYEELRNIPKAVKEVGFESGQHGSSYYVQNSSFFRIDWMSLGYSFGNIYKKCDLKVSATLQNAFTITSYKGQNPETFVHHDGYQYPHSRTFSIALNLNLR